jgi:hypothetical protein
MKTRLATKSATFALAVAAAAVLVACGSDSTEAPAGDPRLVTWRTDLGGRYARVAEERDRLPVSVWPAAGLLDTSGSSAIPSYADVQRVSNDADWVYVESSGLASHQMGPWYWNATTLFGNWPASQGITFRMPRTPVEKADAERVNVGMAAQGMWVNGVSFFNQLDGFLYDPVLRAERNSGPPSPDFGQDPALIWVRDAIPVEGPSFDASNAHQPPNSEYHYHSNPLALRFQLGDNVVWDSAVGRYSESTATKTHSPILGWARDGYPIYGPYGYANCTVGSTDTAVTRMRSGFVLRDGSNGTSDLRVTGRVSVGKWAAQQHKLSTATADADGRVALAAELHGPAINNYFTLGRYNEDWEFLGDLGQAQGTTFDLDRHNGRSCRTPEFPDGTYAYYTTITSTGTPAYPYTIGRQFRGDPTGGNLTATETIPADVTVVKTSVQRTLPDPTATRQTNGSRLVEWEAAEGVVYKLESSLDGTTWQVVNSAVRMAVAGSNVPGLGFFSLKPATLSVTDTASYASEPRYRLAQVSVDAFEAGVTPVMRGRIEVVSPAVMTRGTATEVTIDIQGNQPIADLDNLNTGQPTEIELVTLDGLTVIASMPVTTRPRTLNIIKGSVTVPTEAVPGTYMWRVRFGPRDTFVSVNQLAGVPATEINTRVTYRDIPITLQ